MRLPKMFSNNRGQEGSILIVALIMLALLSIIGFAATTTSRLDIRIASNEYVAKQNLYAAEGAALELIQHIENGEDEIKWMDVSTPSWLVVNITGQNNAVPAQPTTPFDSVDNQAFPPEIIDVQYWEGNYPNPLVRPSAFLNNTEALAFYLGVAPGASKDTTKPTVYEYRAYGRSNLYQGSRNDGWCIVEIGFRRVL